MATEVVLVKAGMTMTEGTVAAWHVPDGGEVKVGEPLYQLETEKINLEVEAEASGIVRHVVPEGTTLAPGALVAYILAPGEALPAVLPAPAAQVPDAAGARSAARPALTGGRLAASPISRRLAKEASLMLQDITGTGPGGRITEADVVSAARLPRRMDAPLVTAAATAAGGGHGASPVARLLAEQLGIELAGIAGTGPGGRITREDVEAAAAAPRTAQSPASIGDATVVPVRGMRKVIAERMHASLQEMAQLTMGMEVAMDEAAKLRMQLIAEWEHDGLRLSFTALIMKAVAKALTNHPRLNATWDATEIRLLPEVHMGMAVAVENGLVVPVIRNAERMSLREIGVESTRLAAAARDGKLGLDDMTGGTFSVTTLGTSDVDFFTPIINPPNVAILGVGRLRDAVAWDGDRPVKRQQMTLSLTIDHRAVDGAPGAAFLGDVRDLLEAPYRLLI